MKTLEQLVAEYDAFDGKTETWTMFRWQADVVKIMRALIRERRNEGRHDYLAEGVG